MDVERKSTKIKFENIKPGDTFVSGSFLYMKTCFIKELGGYKGIKLKDGTIHGFCDEEIVERTSGRFIEE